MTAPRREISSSTADHRLRLRAQNSAGATPRQAGASRTVAAPGSHQAGPPPRLRTLHPVWTACGLAAAPSFPSSAPTAAFQRGPLPPASSARLVGRLGDSGTSRRRIGRRPAARSSPAHPGIRPNALSGLRRPPHPSPRHPPPSPRDASVRGSPHRFAEFWNGSFICFIQHLSLSPQNVRKRRLANFFFRCCFVFWRVGTFPRNVRQCSGLKRTRRGRIPTCQILKEFRNVPVPSRCFLVKGGTKICHTRFPRLLDWRAPSC